MFKYKNFGIIEVLLSIYNDTHDSLETQKDNHEN